MFYLKGEYNFKYNLMDNKLAFRAIRSLTDDLNSLFPGKPTTHLSLYCRLIDHINEDDIGSCLTKFISGFVEFFSYNERYFDENCDILNIPKGTVIRYGDSPRAFIEIQKFLYQSTPGDREIIKEHLLTILAVIDPTESVLTKLDKVVNSVKSSKPPPGSREKQLIETIAQKAKNAFSNIDPANSSSNPTEAIMRMLTSGVIEDIAGIIQSETIDGNLDPSMLMQTMQTMMSSMMMSPEDVLTSQKINNDTSLICNNVDITEIIELVPTNYIKPSCSSTIEEIENECEIPQPSNQFSTEPDDISTEPGDISTEPDDISTEPDDISTDL